MVQMGASNTLIQSIVPDHLRGRVMSIYSMMLMGMAPFGSLLAGWGAARIGSPATVAAGGVVCMLGAAAFTGILPRVRTEARRLLRERPASHGN
jgi:MFS family permease